MNEGKFNSETRKFIKQMSALSQR